MGIENTSAGSLNAGLVAVQRPTRERIDTESEDGARAFVGVP